MQRSVPPNRDPGRNAANVRLAGPRR